MTELQHLQNVLLEIAKDIDKLCIENDIVYYLVAGTALGAVRHKGFIPWDDDFDIAMDSKNYVKFLQVAREKLDSSKYCIQEGYVDWPMPFSKVRLLGTVYNESGKLEGTVNSHGIFIDIFPFENAPNHKFARLWQFMCGKLLLSYCLRKRGFESTSVTKKILLNTSHILDYKPLRLFVKKQVERYRNKETDYIASFGGNLKYGNIFFKKSDWAQAIRVSFEDAMFPIPIGYHSILKQQYGDYMELPPENQRMGPHLIGLDFGKF